MPKFAYPVFNFSGVFCHESKHHGSAAQLLEITNPKQPEQIQVKVTAQDTGEVFEAVAELVIVSVKKHSYKPTDAEGNKRNRKDAKKNQKLIAHFPVAEFH